MRDYEWRILGIDYGTRRIGLAICDPSHSLASPLETLDSGAGLMNNLARIIEESNVKLIIVGLPWRSDGAPGTIHTQIKHFATNLKKFGVEVDFQNEAFSSSRAKESMQAVKPGGRRSSKKNKNDRRQGEIDQRAAAIILQDYLNENPNLRLREDT
jgi:putative holliday junction resolvase